MFTTNQTRHPSVQHGWMYVAENIDRAMNHLVSGESLHQRIKSAALEIGRIGDTEHFTSCLSDESLIAFRAVVETGLNEQLTVDEVSTLANRISVFVTRASKDLGLVSAGEDPKQYINWLKVSDWSDEAERPVRKS